MHGSSLTRGILPAAALSTRTGRLRAQRGAGWQSTTGAVFLTEARRSSNAPPQPAFAPRAASLITLPSLLHF